jgi:hypothetical protein
VPVVRLPWHSSVAFLRPEGPLAGIGDLQELLDEVLTDDVRRFRRLL